MESKKREGQALPHAAFVDDAVLSEDHYPCGRYFAALLQAEEVHSRCKITGVPVEHLSSVELSLVRSCNKPACKVEDVEFRRAVSTERDNCSGPDRIAYKNAGILQGAAVLFFNTGGSPDGHLDGGVSHKVVTLIVIVRSAAAAVLYEYGH